MAFDTSDEDTVVLTGPELDAMIAALGAEQAREAARPPARRRRPGPSQSYLERIAAARAELDPWGRR